MAQMAKGKLLVAKFNGKCIHCHKAIHKGDSAFWMKGVGIWCTDCNSNRSTPHRETRYDADRTEAFRDPEEEEGRRERERNESEYQQGLADGRRYSAERRIYGQALADQFAAEDEFNRYWKYGEDY